MLGKKTGQQSFGELEAAARVPESHFLRQIDQQLDWRPFDTALQTLYRSHRGRPSYPPLVLFKALLLQRWYDLSDPGLEEAIRDRLSFQRFLGLSLHDPVPDETTICRFRGTLAKTNLAVRLFDLVAEQLQALGLVIRRGTLIDATLVQAFSKPTVPGRPSKEQEAAWVKQGKKYVFGYKAHVAVDQGSALVRRLGLTAANVPETLVFDEMLPGDEAAVFADRAYDVDARRQALRRRGIFCGLKAKASRHRRLTPAQKQRNHRWERVRTAVERVIGIHKWHYGLSRFPYVGRCRNYCHLLLVSICYNLKRMLVLQSA